ncbi:MAG: hypothetical protein HUK22_04720 [Thermoguttaceae bacterium]|nr:hypothetical protein [Thermoguttaceae bacterium]
MTQKSPLPSIFSPVPGASEYVASFAAGFGQNWRETASAEFASSFVATARTEGVGVAGAGLMGISIAAAFLGGGFPVVVYDPVAAALESAPERVARELASQRARRGVADDDSATEAAIVRETVARLFRASGELGDLASAAAVVETIPEKARIKAKFYKTLEAAARKPILTLTNTSSIRISELAETLGADGTARLRRDRFCGFHFFHPVCKRSLLEIIRGAETSAETLAAAAALGEAIHKTPITVEDGPGFLVNRLLQPYLNEGLALLEEGVPAARVEAAARRFGFEAGPLRIMDEIGLDVSLHAGWTFFKAYPERTLESQILPELARRGELGRKTRRGFYRFDGAASWEDDATLDCDSARISGLLGRDAPLAQDAADEKLAARMALAILFEGARLVADGIVPTPREADAGLTLALGFPADKGGIFYWARNFGREWIVAEAEKLADLGERFTPPENLDALLEF